jgi:protein phosphatase/serine/threonine-protein phosphatase Stp1
MTGVYGKLPAHGDFVRRDLPQAFVEPWDEWLQVVVGAAREALGDGFAAHWAAAPPWRFRLPAGLCGDSPVAGVLIASRDAVGRPFPLTLAARLARGVQPPEASWFAALESAGLDVRDQGDTVDVLLARLPKLAAGDVGSGIADGLADGWWSRDGRRLTLRALPTVGQFRAMLQGPDRDAAGRPVARGVSHRGTVRERNEDAFVDRGDIGLWAVADGAGGHEAGDVASAAVVAALAGIPVGLSAAEVLAQVRLRLAQVHADLQRLSGDRPGGRTSVTTVVALLVRGDHFACLWAGDSRAYLLRDGALCQVTRDHSLVQEMVESGLLAPEDAEAHPQANVITRAVGSKEALELDKVSGRLQAGDVLLLCTDGLFKALPESQIADLLAAGGGPEPLLERALSAGARDNVTVLTVAA